MDDPALTFLTGLIDKGGPAVLSVIFAFLYWNERKERQQMTAVLIDVLPKTIAAIETMKVILKGGS